MTKGEILQTYKHMAADDQRTFERWLKANAVIGSMFAAVIFAMAWAGSDASGPRHATAQSTENTAFSARQGNDEQRTSETDGEGSRILSVYELTIRIAPDQLPLQQVDEPF